MNIYQIQNEYQLIIAEVINNEGEITPELETALAISGFRLSSDARINHLLITYYW